MNKLVVLEKNVPLTTSLVLAKGTENEHRSVIRLIKKHKSQLETFGVLRFEITKPKNEKGGRPQEICFLNEQQTTLLLTFMSNTEIIVAFKTALVKEFYRLRNCILQIQVNHQNEQWQQARLEGKAVRKETTDAIKDFIEYAVKQGSTNAVRYYSNISKMENKALFILEQKFDNVREVLNNHQLSTLKTADRIVYETLQEGMERGMNYKDIYQLAKERVETLATLIKPTIVINQIEIKLLEGDK